LITEAPRGKTCQRKLWDSWLQPSQLGFLMARVGGNSWLQHTLSEAVFWGEPADNLSGILLARAGGTWLQHTLSVAVLCAIHHELEILVQVHSHCNAKKVRMSVDNGCAGASTVRYKHVGRNQRTHSKQDHVHQREASRRGHILYAVK